MSENDVPPELRVLAFQIILADLDHDTDQVEQFMSSVTERDDAKSVWSELISAFLSVIRAYTTQAIEDAPSKIWTIEQLNAGHRTTAAELAPARLRSDVLAAVDRHAHQEPVTAPSGRHLWERTEVGEPEGWAALALLAWVMRQPQVADEPMLLRENILDNLLRAQSEIDGSPVPEVSDDTARRVLLQCFDGDDVFDLDTRAGDGFNLTQLKALTIARQWLLVHSNAEPDAEQMKQLRRDLLTGVFGLRTDAVHDSPMKAVPDDAALLSSDDRRRVDLLGQKLFHAFLTWRAPEIRDLAAEIDRYGEHGYRVATAVLHDWASLLITTLPPARRPRTSTIVPAVRAAIDRRVPEPKRADTDRAYLPTLMLLAEEGNAEFVPRPTNDVEADLWLNAAFATAVAESPVCDLAQVMKRLTGLITYLESPTRMLTLPAMTPGSRVRVGTALAEQIGPDAAALLRDRQAWQPERGEAGARRLDDMTALMLAACDVENDPNAVHQVWFIHQLIRLSDQSPAPAKNTRAARPSSPDDLAARRQAEKQLRNRRKRKK